MIKPKTFKVGEDVLISFHTNFYDGPMSGYCYFKGKYCYFNIHEERYYERRMTEEEIQECKDYFAEKGRGWDVELEYNYTSVRKFAIHAFKTDKDALNALANRALWEDFVGFQNSHDGTFGPRFNSDDVRNRHEPPNKNDYKFFNTITKEVNFHNYFKKIPYKPLTSQINDKKILGYFYQNDTFEQYEKDGWTIVDD